MEIPTDSCLISSVHLATPVRPQLVGKALSATRGLAPGGLGTRQQERTRKSGFKTTRSGPEKPRIRLGCPSRSTFSQAPRMLLLVDFGRKEYGYRTSWRLEAGLTALQEPTLTVLLVLPGLGAPKNFDIYCLKVKAPCVIRASFACHRETNVPRTWPPPHYNECPSIFGLPCFTLIC